MYISANKSKSKDSKFDEGIFKKEMSTFCREQAKRIQNDIGSILDLMKTDSVTISHPRHMDKPKNSGMILEISVHKMYGSIESDWRVSLEDIVKSAIEDYDGEYYGYDEDRAILQKMQIGYAKLADQLSKAIKSYDLTAEKEDEDA